VDVIALLALVGALVVGEPFAGATREVKRNARAEAAARFDAARTGDPFLDFWFAPDARSRIDGLVERLTKKR